MADLKIYLDICIYSRPFDDQGQDRISLETNAFIYLLNQIQNGEYIVMDSEILRYENGKDPDPVRKERVSSYLMLSREFVGIDERVLKRGIYLRKLGFENLDALHLALAEKGGADYFLTCDDSIPRKADSCKVKLKTNVMGLLKFVAMEAR